MTSNNVVSVTYDTLLFLYVWLYIHVCIVTHKARMWINRVGLPILLVVS